MTDPGPIFDALIDVGRPAMGDTWRDDSCIAATAIVIETLRAFDLYAKPLAVEVVALTAPLSGWVRDGSTGPLPPGSHEVDIGRVESDVIGPGGLTAGKELHVVAWLAPWLIDLSLDQASRPAKGLVLRPSVWTVPDGAHDAMLAGEPVGWRQDDGSTVSYRVRPGVTWYRLSHNWRRRDAAIRSRVVGKVIRAVREGSDG